MQAPSSTNGIAKSYENIYDHGQRVRVKAWVAIQAGDLEEAKKPLLTTDLCDRSQVRMPRWNGLIEAVIS